MPTHPPLRLLTYEQAKQKPWARGNPDFPSTPPPPGFMIMDSEQENPKGVPCQIYNTNPGWFEWPVRGVRFSCVFRYPLNAILAVPVRYGVAAGFQRELHEDEGG